MKNYGTALETKISRSSFARPQIFYIFVLLRARNTRIPMLMILDEKRLDLSRPGFIIPVSLKVSLSSLNNEDEH